MTTVGKTQRCNVLRPMNSTLGSCAESKVLDPLLEACAPSGQSVNRSHTGTMKTKTRLFGPLLETLGRGVGRGVAHTLFTTALARCDAKPRSWKKHSKGNMKRAEAVLLVAGFKMDKGLLEASSRSIYLNNHL